MPSKERKPIQIGEMSLDTITANTKIINSQHDDKRLTFILERLVQHLHDFARETRLSVEEWETGIEFLTQVGKMCSDIRQEFILLSDTLGLSVLVDGLSNPKPEGATIGTLLGPFHTHDAEMHESGTSVCSDGKGEPLLIEGSVCDVDGTPLVGATLDLWECDENGLYDTQYADRDGPDMRGLVKTDENGKFIIKCTKPVPYPIPHDGPVGKWLEYINRHPYRPAHIHFIIEKEGYEKLITALYKKGDPYEKSDAVFGVKSPLLFELDPLGKERAEKYNMKETDWFLKWDFRMITKDAAKKVRVDANTTAMKSFTKLEGKYELDANGMPIAALD